MLRRVEYRTYQRKSAVVFRITRERFGGLSNMAGGFPLTVNGYTVPSSEALYQACRYPHDPEIQKVIIAQASPMTAKMKSKRYRERTRDDWNSCKVRVMRWCLQVKLAQHWDTFGLLLRQTGNLPIVEESTKDAFWGAKKVRNTLVGGNVLGRLLMELRDNMILNGTSGFNPVYPPDVPDFWLLGEPVRPVPLNPIVSPDAQQIRVKGSLNLGA